MNDKRTIAINILLWFKVRLNLTRECDFIIHPFSYRISLATNSLFLIAYARAFVISIEEKLESKLIKEYAD